jgi:hypothetical protein
MAFETGHEKRGGRLPGTLNKTSREAREVARGLLSDPEYLNSLKARLVQGQAPRVEIHLWELAYGRPRAELDAASERADPAADIAQLLQKFGEDDKPGVDRHDGGPPATPERNEGAN